MLNDAADRQNCMSAHGHNAPNSAIVPALVQTRKLQFVQPGSERASSRRVA